ncbi:MAG: large subunit ribosomal protein [Deferribacteres bacterium]|jgi:large subunit ribosomal protein L21|nr:ribosomal protein [Deferribacteraceae bacterium]MDK2792247.1 large subunit ribosomal protein [Deferribacteres bacterium]
MFAIVKTGGKQFTVKPGDIITVEKIDAEKGAAVKFENILAVSKDGELTVGSPVVQGALVEAEVLEQTRGEKIIVFKRKRRKDYKKKQGHRQYLTKVRIKDIKVG